MVTRRDLFKGGGVAAAGLAAASLASCSTESRDVVDTTSEVPDLARTLTVDRFRRGGVGPLYWSTYGYNNRTNQAMPQAVWEKNLDWVAESLAPSGYKMVCTDG